MERHFEVPQGATPIADCSDLIPGWVHTSHDLNRVEAENILKAQKKHLKSSHPKNWFHPEKLKAIHQDMFKDVWNWAGMYRKSTTSIGIKPGLIPTRLAGLCFEVNLWWENLPQLTLIEMAARIHHQLVSIHPFENRILQLAIKAGLESIARILIEKGADIHAIDRSGLTPFQTAVAQNNKSLTDFLIAKGAKPKAPPGTGYTQYYHLYRE